MDGEEEDWNLEQPEGKEEGAIEAVYEYMFEPIRAKKYTAYIFSIDRPGEVCAVSEVKVWEKVRVQVG